MKTQETIQQNTEKEIMALDEILLQNVKAINLGFWNVTWFKSNKIRPESSYGKWATYQLS